MAKVSADTKMAPAVEKMIAAKFAPEDWRHVRELLLTFNYRGWRGGPERVFRAVLHLAQGDLIRMERLMELANTSWRDLLVAAEFEEVNGVRVKAKWVSEGH